MKNIPEKIYLQIDFEPDETDDYKQLYGVTWSDRRINDSDLEYSLPEHKAEASPIVWVLLLLFIFFAGWVAFILYRM